MVKLGDFEVGQTWLITNQAKRVARILATGRIEVEVPASEPTKPPTKEMRGTVTALICTPAKPIPGHVTAEEADQGLVHRLRCKNDFGYDMWQEVWMDHPRHPVILTGKPRVIEDEWEWVLRVHQVIGRHDRHEKMGAHGKLGPRNTKPKFLGSGTTIDGILIPPEDVHPQLFEELGVDEKTQAQLEMAAHDKAVIENYEKQKAIDAKEARTGDASLCKDWGPNMKLKAQLGICGLERPSADGGNFNELARTILSTYLKGIGVNPWDVMLLTPEDFKEAVDTARQKMPV